MSALQSPPPTTAAAAAAFILALNLEQRRQLEAQIHFYGEVCNVESIPSEVRKQFDDLKSAANSRLAEMLQGGDVLGTLQAGNEVAGALSWAQRSMERFGEYLKEARTAAETAMSRLKQTTSPQALATHVDAAIRERMGRGEILDKAMVEAAVNTAREQGATAARAQMALHGQRTKALTEASLPAVDVALNAESNEAFDVLLTTGRKRLGQLRELSSTLGFGESLSRFAFCPDADWDAQLSVLKSVLAAPPAAPSRPIDPLATHSGSSGRTVTLVGAC